MPDLPRGLDKIVVSGPRGPGLLTGQGAPSLALGKTGDSYLDLQTADLWQRSTVWEKIASTIFGPVDPSVIEAMILDAAESVVGDIGTRAKVDGTNVEENFASNAGLADRMLGNLSNNTTAWENIEGDARVDNCIDLTGTRRFPTLASVELSSISSEVDTIIVGRRAAGRVRVDAPFERVASEPSHAAKVQSADGQWWEFSGTSLPAHLFDIRGDKTTDDRAGLIEAFGTSDAMKLPLVLIGGRGYVVSSQITINPDYWNLRTDNGQPAQIIFTAMQYSALSVGAIRTADATVLLTTNGQYGDKILTVASTASMLKDDILEIESNKAFSNDPRVDGQITEKGSGTVQGSSAVGVILDPGFTLAPGASLNGKSITIESGPCAGLARRVTSFNATTKTAFVTPAWPTPRPDTTSTYIFPQAFKGLVTRVVRVIDNTRVEIEDGLPDGFRVTTADSPTPDEEVNVAVFRPIKGARCENIEILGPGVASQTIGLTIGCMTEPYIAVSVRGIAFTGVAASRCIGGIVTGTMRECNDFDAGYGVQIRNSTRFEAYGVKAFNCRRGVDVSGTLPSLYCGARRCEVNGGGLQEDGAAYTPIGTFENFGMGTHGAAIGAYFIDCFVQNVSRGVSIRGRDTLVSGLLFGVGITRNCIFKSFPGELTVEGCQSLQGGFDNVAGLADVGDEVYAPFNAPMGERYPQSFLELDFNVGQNDEIKVINNRVKTNQWFMSFRPIGTGNVLNMKNLVFQNNDINVYPATTTTETALIGRISPSMVVNISGGRFKDNNIRTAPGNAQPLKFGAGVQISSTSGTVVEFDTGTFVAVVAQGQVAKIPIGASTFPKIRVGLTTADSAAIFEAYMTKGSTGAYSPIIETASAFEVLSAAPAAGGGTSGKTQIHAGPSDLTIGNRRTSGDNPSVYMTTLATYL